MCRGDDCIIVNLRFAAANRDPSALNALLVEHGDLAPGEGKDAFLEEVENPPRGPDDDLTA